MSCAPVISRKLPFWAQSGILYGQKGIKSGSCDSSRVVFSRIQSYLCYSRAQIALIRVGKCSNSVLKSKTWIKHGFLPYSLRNPCFPKSWASSPTLPYVLKDSDQNFRKPTKKFRETLQCKYPILRENG